MENTNKIPLNFTPLKITKKNLTPSRNWLNILFVLIFAISVIAILIIILLYRNRQPTKNKLTPTPSIAISPTLSPLEMRLLAPTIKIPTPTLIPSPTLTSPPTPIVWKTYTSPVIGNDFYSFQLSYPSTWQINEEATPGDGGFLNVALINKYNDTIVIFQGNGEIGTCVYYDDSDYTTFSGEAAFFSSYTSMAKPADWRISQLKDGSNPFSTVCEKYKNGRYVTFTKIGWVGVKQVSSTKEAQSILETIVFKPTAATKTIFD